jgi:hypothetical protein
MYEIWDLLIGVIEESSLLRCDATSLGEKKSSMTIRNVMNHSPNDTALHPETLESEIYCDYSEVGTEMF